jgi:predicted dehydrogenase
LIGAPDGPGAARDALSDSQPDSERRPAASRDSARRRVAIAVARLTHGHVSWILGRADKDDIELVGIYEPDPEVVERYVDQFGFDRRLVQSDLGKMLDTAKPRALAAFGSIAEHLAVVEAAAPRGIHVMVEKPLAFSLSDAKRTAEAAKRHGIHVLTNYETTWYPSGYTAFNLVHHDKAIGPIRKVVIRDGHFGPKELDVAPEFLSWLTDPVQNGGGALIDFGCYGANLITWLMLGAAPLTVTAVTQRLKHDPTYAKVDDEATIVLTYPEAQAIIQGSWNWPDHRKDLEIFGTHGYVFTPDATSVRTRLRGERDDRAVATQTLAPDFSDGFAYLAAVVRGELSVSDSDRSSLANNLIVVRILDAARRSAQSGQTITLEH